MYVQQMGIPGWLMLNGTKQGFLLTSHGVTCLRRIPASHHRGVERESEADTTVEEEPSAEQPCHRLASPTSKPMTTLQLLATRLCHRLGVFFYRNRCTIGLACAQAIALRGAPTTARRHVSAPRRRPPPHLAADHFDGPTLARVVRVVLLF